MYNIYNFVKLDIYIIIYNILRKYVKKHLTYILDYSFN